MRINKILSILILLFVFAGQSVLAQQDKSSYAEASEDKPKLRWEYKYKEGETLMYLANGKDIATSSYSREIEGVLGIKIISGKENGKKSAHTWTQLKRINDEDMKYQRSSTYSESIGGGIEIGRDGNIENIFYGSVFHLSIPRFVESELDVWSKEIELNENIGGAAGKRIKLTGYYRKLIGEEVIKGKKCILIETEIGPNLEGNENESGRFIAGGDSKYRMKLYAKSWFSPEDGRVIKMESELKLFDDAEKDIYTSSIMAKKILEGNKQLYKNEAEWKTAVEKIDDYIKEMEKTGKRTGKKSKEEVNRHFTYELLDEKEVKKIEGIEENWEWVMQGARFTFELTPEGNIVIAKGETTKEKGEDGKEKEVTKNYIYMCDGKNNQKITEGDAPAISPDGKMIMFVRGNDVWLKYLDDSSEEKIFSARKNRLWSTDSKWILLDTKIEEDDIAYILSIKTKEIKKIKKVADLIDNPFPPPYTKIKREVVSNTEYRWPLDKFIFFGDRILDLENKKFVNFDQFKSFNNIKFSKTRPIIMANKYFGKDENDFIIFDGKKSFRNIIKYELVNLSEKGEIINEKIIGDFRCDKSFWSKEERCLIYFRRIEEHNESYVRIYIYDFNKEKNIFESEKIINRSISREFYFNPDFTYLYFPFESRLSHEYSTYRMKSPKELQEKIGK